MNAPVRAALAPGVLVAGRMVSAISSRNATSAALNEPAPWAVTVSWTAASGIAARIRSPSTSAALPRRTATRWTASRRETGSEIPTFELLDGKRHRSSRERHVGERRVLARRRGHAGAVGDEDVRTVPHLIAGVEHRRLRVTTH